MLFRLFLNSTDPRLAHRAAHALEARYGRKVTAGAEVRNGRAAVWVEAGGSGPPLWELLEQVQLAAGQLGAVVVETELDGPVPLAAVLAVARHALMLRELDRGQVGAGREAGAGPAGETPATGPA